MIPRPPDEPLRLAALHSYMLLDTEADDEFDLLTELAAELCGAPYSFVSLVDADRVWFKSRYGANTREQMPRDQDYCAWSILEDEELNIPDLTADVRTATLLATTSGPQFRMYNGVNLISADGYRVGVLCVMDTQPRQLTPNQQRLLRRLARQVIALMELRLMERELKSALVEVSRLAHEDELTGLRNRRAWMAEAQQQLQLARRLGTPLCMMMVDVDHFKKVNDTYGHPAGDAVLRALGQLLSTSLRATDVAGRLGGEEFAVLLPGTHVEGASRVAEGLRQLVEAERIQDVGAVLHVTASIGLAKLAPANPGDADPDALATLMRAADQALYTAKQTGRNRLAWALATG
jgi:diguanylate cyclase (GGDEF)-like protein